MADFYEEMFEAADSLEAVDTDTTKTLSNLVRQLEDLNANIEHTEAELKKLKQEKNRLSMENIPALMDEMGVDRIDVDGVSVQLGSFVSASIPPDRKQEAYE